MYSPWISPIDLMGMAYYVNPFLNKIKKQNNTISKLEINKYILYSTNYDNMTREKPHSY